LREGFRWAYSPDGRQVATLNGTEIIIRQVETGKEAHRLRSLLTDGPWLTWSPDGRTLAARGSSIKVWEIATGKELYSLSKVDNPVLSSAWGANNQQVFLGDKDGNIVSWDIATGRQNLSVATDQGAINGLALSRDGRQLASCGSNGTVKVWDAANLKESRKLVGLPNNSSNNGRSLAWSPDGRQLALGGIDGSSPTNRTPIGTVIIWNIATGKQGQTLRGHSETVLSVSWSPDGHWLASGSKDKTIKIWNVSTGREERTLQGHSFPVFSVAWSKNGHRLASGASGLVFGSGQGKTGEVRIWETETWEQVFSLPWGTGLVNWSPQGYWLAISQSSRGGEPAEGPAMILDGTP
jgi:WD40 repeat protein